MEDGEWWMALKIFFVSDIQSCTCEAADHVPWTVLEPPLQRDYLQEIACTARYAVASLAMTKRISMKGNCKV